MSNHISYNNLDISNIIYKEPNNKLSLLLLNNVKNVEPMLIYTPILKVKQIIDNKLILDITGNTKFHDFLRRIDELNISNSYYNAKKWFKKEISLEIIEKYYKSSINNKNEVEFIIPINSNNELTLDYILDENKNYVNIHSIKEDTLVKLNIKYIGIKFKNKSFEPKIEIKSIKICDSIKKKNNYDDTSDDNSSDEDYSDNSSDDNFY